MSDFDWRSQEAFDTRMQSAENPDFAWEFLRLNGNYRSDCASLGNGGLAVGVGQLFRKQWGLSFRS
jgi:hypothetical protein